MLYKYTARTTEGESIKGTIRAKKKDQALGRLENRGFAVDEVKIDWWKMIIGIASIDIGGVSLREKLIFTRNLALMIRSGITINIALGILAQQTANKKLTKILTRVKDDVESGSSFSEAIAEYPKVFDDLYVNIIAASERSGTLAESLEQLGKQIKRIHDLRAKILGAMFYPVLVVVSTVVIGIALSIYVLPKITGLFRSFDTELPWTTKVVIWFAEFMTDHTFLAIGTMIGVVVLLICLFRASVLKPVWHKTLFRLPVIGKVVKQFNLALFSRTLNTLLVSGVPINQALEITARTMRNVRYKKAFQEMVVEQQSGEILGFLLSQRESLFPPIVHRMISVGEESGNLEESLGFIANFHEEELDYTTKNISSVVEPLLLIVVGVVVAVLALAIITPIYSITGSFQQQ